MDEAERVVTLTFSLHNTPDTDPVTFKQMIGICQRFNISRGLKRGLLSQKEYFVYFTNICSAATVTESSFLGIQTEFTGMWHFPGL